MSKVIKVPAHDNGYTCLAFSVDGKRVFTGGHDCIVRIWKVDEGEEQEPETAMEAEEGVTSIATTEDCWLSGSVDAAVRRYSKNSTQLDALITTTNGIPVRCVSADPTGRWVAVSSDEHFVKVIDAEDITQVRKLEGYKAGVRSVTWNQSGTRLATSTADGKIVIWDMHSQEPTIEKTIDGMIPSVADSESKEFLYDCSVVWSPKGDSLFVATKTHELVEVSCSTWSKKEEYNNKNFSGAVTALAISPNGRYIASSTQSTVFIWSTSTRGIVAQQVGNPGAIITKVAFSPKENLVAWTDAEGSFTRWIKPVDGKYPDPVRTAAASAPKSAAGPSLFDDDETLPITDTLDDLADIHLDDAMSEMDDNWIVDDTDGAHRVEAEPVKTNGLVKEMVSITKAQPAFQPGSTPFDRKRRYLAYNTIGTIDVTETDLHNVVNVEVFDQSVRQGFHFSDSNKSDIGSIGERGVLFASPSQGEHPAELKFRGYGSWNAYEWTYSLRPGTRILGVTGGALPLTSSSTSENDLQGYGNVVLATSEDDLTFLSGTGRERRIMGLGGDFVTMVASAEWVFVVYRPGSATIDGSQNLSYCIINFDDFSVRQRDILPIPKGHTLVWAGVSDLGAPVVYDSAGYLHTLTKYRVPHHASWARILDTNLLERRQGKDESYWPVGVNGNNFVCLILKGRQTHPGFPKPLIQEIPLQIPFRKVDEREEALERELLNISLMLDNLDDELTTDDIVKREAAIDKEFLVLIQGACKGANIPRALELVKLVHNIQALDLVIKVADFYHLPGFKEKVQLIKADREENEDRLVAARNKRKRWLKAEAAPREIVAPRGNSNRFDPLGDIRPPPPVSRPGLQRVTEPVVERSKYSSNIASSSQPSEFSTFTEEPETRWEDETLPESPPSGEGKRKRLVDDDIQETSEWAPPPKTKANPFARKAAQDTSKNVFARRAQTITLAKSDSFFDKVEAAETDGSKKRTQPFKRKEDGKGKEKKEPGKQATLFSMLPKAPGKKPVEKATQEDETQATDIAMFDVDAETQAVDSQLDSQMEEIQLADVGETV